MSATEAEGAARPPRVRQPAGVGPSRAVVLVLAAALVVRVVVVLATGDFSPRVDPADYHRHALSIAHGDGYPGSTFAEPSDATAVRPPVYPYFLGALYALSGDSWTAARLAQAVVGTLTVALLGLVVGQVFGRRPALVAMAIAAVYPALVAVGATFLSEVLFVPLVLGALAAALRHRSAASRWRWAAAAGALGGLAVLTRSNGALMLLPLAALVWGTPWRARRALVPPAVLLLAAALVVAPWMARNASAIGSFTVTTQAGFTLAGTYNATSHRDARHPGAWRPFTFDPALAALYRRTPPDEVARERALRAAALRYARDHPLYVAEVAVRNAARLAQLTGPREDVALPPWLERASRAGFLLVALAALAAAASGAARGAPRALWALPVLLAAPVVVLGFPRFRLPLDPFLIALAALGAIAAAKRIAGRTRAPAAAAAGGA